MFSGVKRNRLYGIQYKFLSMYLDPPTNVLGKLNLGFNNRKDDIRIFTSYRVVLSI